MNKAYMQQHEAHIYISIKNKLMEYKNKITIIFL